MILEITSDPPCILRRIKKELDDWILRDSKASEFLFWIHQKSKMYEPLIDACAMHAFYLETTFSVVNRNFITGEFNGEKRNLGPSSFDVNFGFARELSDFAFGCPPREKELSDVLVLEQRIFIEWSLLRVLKQALDANYLANHAPSYDPFRPCPQGPGPYCVDPSPELVWLLYMPWIDVSMRQQLKEMHKEFPCIFEWNIVKKWWQDSGDSWIDKFRAWIVKEYDIGHDWDFEKSTYNALFTYLASSKTIVQCLRRSCRLTEEDRQGIEKGILSPFE